MTTSLAVPTGRQAVEAVLWGGLAAGVLDIIFAFAVWIPRGATATRVLQSISSGLLGPSAFSGGAATALLGLALHFFIATTAAAVYVAASRKLPVLVRHAAMCGLAYGVAVYFFMSKVVLPLSNVARSTGGFSLSALLRDATGHALLVGLPIALLARRSVRRADPGPTA